MKITIAFLILMSFELGLATQALAQQSQMAAQTIVSGKYEVGGGLTFNPSTSLNTDFGGSLGYFYRDNLSFDASLGVGLSTARMTINPGIGLSYYLSKSGPMASFVSQNFSVSTSSALPAFGTTNVGVLYLLNEQLGFKVFGQLSYLLESPSPKFLVLGTFTILL
jgi:hypothetical protein